MLSLGGIQRCTSALGRTVLRNTSCARYSSASISRIPSAYNNSILNVENTSDSLRVTGLLEATQPVSFSHLWLRDNCLCPQCIHPSTRQKVHSSGNIPLDIKPIDVTTTDEAIKIQWNKPLEGQNASEPHVSIFPKSWLQSYASKENRSRFRFNEQAPLPWGGKQCENAQLWIDYKDFANPNSTVALYRALDHLFQYGIVFLKDVPTEDHSVVKVAEHIGPIKNTFYGTSWDVKSKRQSKNVAYTDLNLGYHMDLLYFANPPGLQFLHSLQNSVKGGASIFTDSFHAAMQLKKTQPHHYETLCKTPVTFHYVNDNHHMYYRRPTIVEDGDDGSPAWRYTINYAPPFQGPLDVDDPKLVKPFYEAFQAFEKEIARPENMIELTLNEGDLGNFRKMQID
ncbi:hypothetical protein BZG36_02103 [Bifiguratus adelaidae]|uniref:Uncharacterized protein n=1 Tax=Bifiguratus adelaidae TaxID=1938954 RepID=A0A261Y395_9FUNG|nr:hypothetical protein BZG36_02103 [Bifiguratus adelaidae]